MAETCVSQPHSPQSYSLRAATAVAELPDRNAQTLDREEPEIQSRYHCSPEWHLSRLTSTPFAGLLYSFALRISKTSRSFHGSVVGIAAYFDVSRWKIQRAIEALVELGFFICVAREAFRPSEYRVVPHQEWAAQHPGCCVVKEAFPWSTEEGDTLGVRLWNASGGRMKYMSYQLKALRNTGLTDDEILARFEVFVAAEKAKRQASGNQGRWGAVHHRFLRYLYGSLRAQELAALGLQPFRTVETVAAGK